MLLHLVAVVDLMTELAVLGGVMLVVGVEERAVVDEVIAVVARVVRIGVPGAVVFVERIPSLIEAGFGSQVGEDVGAGLRCDVSLSAQVRRSSRSPGTSECSAPAGPTKKPT